MLALDNKSISASIEEREEEVLMSKRVRRERVVDLSSRIEPEWEVESEVGSGLTLVLPDSERLIRVALDDDDEAAALGCAVSMIAANAGKGEELSEIPGMSACQVYHRIDVDDNTQQDHQQTALSHILSHSNPKEKKQEEPRPQDQTLSNSPPPSPSTPSPSYTV